MTNKYVLKTKNYKTGEEKIRGEFDFQHEANNACYMEALKNDAWFEEGDFILCYIEKKQII